MTRDRRDHVHPECYSPGDPLEIRRHQLHPSFKHRVPLCEVTWCTFQDMTQGGRDEAVAQAKALKVELKSLPEPFDEFETEPYEAATATGAHGRAARTESYGSF